MTSQTLHAQPAGRPATAAAGDPTASTSPDQASKPPRTTLSLGVMGRSQKENEHRLALHPRHLERVPADLRSRIYLESGYGERFGVGDEQLAELVAGVRSHRDLVEECDVILQPKPLHADVAELREGQVLWGWPHCVQDQELTQLAIDRGLTLIAFEAMNHWKSDGSFGLHVFHKNNELAGYSSVLHALQLAGSTGDYGPRLRAVVIGFGATARGAVTALSALGVSDVDVLTARQVAAVAAPIPSARILHFDSDDEAPAVSHVVTPEGKVPLAQFLGEHDIIVNCVLQDTDAPLVFLTHDDLHELSPGTLVVDVSCDEGMGFEWARPTTFADPTFVVGRDVLYYAVDHSPSHLWRSATWEISEALLRFVGPVMEGPAAWDRDVTIRRGIEIRDGVVQNPAILSFQGRSAEHPHEFVTG
jgi:alanine dehydrogenase